MSKGIAGRLTGTLMLFLIIFPRGFTQGAGVTPLRFMFYNVENFFDTYDDTLTEDDEFTPGGNMKWNITKYKRKTSSVYKTIIAAGGWDPPSVIAFSEIENRKVLGDLVYGTPLSKYGYAIVHEDSPDPRGIDVCLIYREDIVEIITCKYWIPGNPALNNFDTRSILYAKCEILKDTIHLIVNHWPSRRGGVLSGDNQRSELAELIKYRTDSIATACGGRAKIVIMGDFNCAPGSPAIKTLIDSSNPVPLLVNLSENNSAGPGTYRYMGIWEMVDQIIISAPLLDCSEGLYTTADSFRVFKPDFLMRKDRRYPGMSPFSTYQGYRYQGGFSDHLPVLLDLKIRSKDSRE